MSTEPNTTQENDPIDSPSKTSLAPGFALDAYLQRIGYQGTRSASLALLTSIHEHHLAAIPFENLDVRLGRPVRLDLESLQEKLVHRRRGGYCFEQNALLAAALRTLGFQIKALEARVRPGPKTKVTPRNHMLLQAHLEGLDWLADVGFGGDGPLRPVPMDGSISRQPGGEYRIIAEGSHKVLQVHRQETWEDLYAFLLEPVYPIDFELANYYTSTHPDSIFVKKLTLQLSLAEARHYLRGHHYIIRRGDAEESRDLTSSEVVTLVRDLFGLDVEEHDILSALRES